MNAVVVLQARTNSSRLPAKVLLPLGGMPMAVLAARRAGNTGRRVLVATSTEPDDDALAALLAEHGIPCFRGSLTDTLGRFVAALDGLDDRTAVIRLTADNPLPDGAFIDELIADFANRGLEYLACNGMPCGVPYGMSAEVIHLGKLREAALNSESQSDHEHVTPFVVRECGVTWFEKYRELGMGHFRCTVDGYDDYQCLLNVFSSESDPVGAPALRLVQKLRQAPFQPTGAAPVPKLVVGGAQLGMPYGIANRSGQPNLALASEMLKSAIANGSAWIDTAHAYAGSEDTIGRVLTGGWAERVKVITKLAPLADLSPQCEHDVVRARVDASIATSCMRLRRSRLDAVLLHRASQLTDWDGAAWQRLRDISGEGHIGAIGVSVQSPEELESALGFEDVRVIQLPFNILDWRWDDAIKRLNSARGKRSITVHARSALLQGLLTSCDGSHWRRAHVANAEGVWAWLSEQTHRYGRIDVIDLCLAYVRSQPWIDGVVVGMEAMEQVQSNIRYFLTADFAGNELADIRKAIPRLSRDTLDPSRWSPA